MFIVHEHIDALDLDLDFYDLTFLFMLTGKAAYICCQEKQSLIRFIIPESVY